MYSSADNHHVQKFSFATMLSFTPPLYVRSQGASRCSSTSPAPPSSTPPRRVFPAGRPPAANAGMGPHSFQAQYVRYQGSEVNTQGCWSAAHSPGAAEQGHVADFVGLEVLEAPAEWAMPARVDR